MGQALAGADRCLGVVFACNGVATIDPENVADYAYGNEARISNNSWGNEDSGAYTADSQEYDDLVRDARPGSTSISRWSRCSPPATPATV